MNEHRSTIRSRELGDELRHAMEKANLNGKLAAKLLGWSESKVSRLLMGYQIVNESDIAALLALCLVKGDEKDRLMTLAREYDVPGWLQKHPPFETLVNLERRATEITEFEVLRVPGLLQTGDYARALLAGSAVVTPDGIEPRIEKRLRRQDLFDRHDRPECTFYLHELVFYLPIGGPEVMSAQMHHLLRMSVRSYIVIRVIPAAIGAYGSTDGACRLMEFSHQRPIAYVEEQTAGHFMEEPDEITTYRRVFAKLANNALNEEQSRELVGDLAIRLYGEDRDGGQLAQEQLQR